MGTREGWVGIRQLADRLDLPLSTLHYWERRGLIDAHRRGAQRYYDADQVRRITLIRLWQATGLMSLEEIAAVLRGRTESASWRDAVTSRIGAIDAQLDRLRSARAYLAHMLSCPREHPPVECPKLRAEVDQVAFNPASTDVLAGMNHHTEHHNAASIGAHHDWHSAAYVQNWIASDATRDEQRRPYLRWAASLLPLQEVPARVLDVGGGYGEFSGQLLAQFPQATVCVQDYSAAMLEQARANLAEYSDRVCFAQTDLTDPDWVNTLEGPFDAVVSALAIHNLGGGDAIRPAYAAIHFLLRPGGWFLNLDLALNVYFAPADSPLAQLYTRASTTPSHEHHHDPEHHQQPPLAAPSLEDHLNG